MLETGGRSVELIEWVQAALRATPAVAEELLLVRDLAGRSFRSTGPPAGVTAREGAVLLLFFPVPDDLQLPLIVRSTQLTLHRGEVGLPGGGVEPGDQDRAATALRECFEELGVPDTMVTVLGALPPIYITPSNFRITPVVGWCAEPPTLVPNPAEVDAVLLTGLRALLDPAVIQVERRTLRGTEVLVPYFAIAGYQVWGATALILSELTARLRRS